MYRIAKNLVEACSMWKKWIIIMNTPQELIDKYEILKIKEIYAEKEKQAVCLLCL